MLRVLGIGDNTVDIYLDEGMQYPGGNAVNVAVQAGRAAYRAGLMPRRATASATSPLTSFLK